MLASTRMQHGDGSPYLVFEYQTDLRMWDEPNARWQDLSNEVDEVWPFVRVDAENGHFASVTIIAHEVPHGIFSKRSPAYNSIFLRDAEGVWHRVPTK